MKLTRCFNTVGQTIRMVGSGGVVNAECNKRTSDGNDVDFSDKNKGAVRICSG